MNSFLNKRFSSFTYLNITQFLGALNDNIYKLLVVYRLIDLQGIGESHKILATTGAIFVLPFLLFSAMSGTLADRFSKRNIIVLTKALELIVMACGVISFAYHSPLGLYATLFLLATQSALFGPSKYGILPEIVSTDRITRANGLMTSFTFLAIILGTFIASFITDVTGRNFILGSLLCTVLSLIGVITSIGIEYTPPSGSEKKVDARFLQEIYKTLKLARTVPSLLPAILGSAFFLFLGAFLQLNIIPFAVYSLSLTDVQGGYLFLLTALGIGTGSVIAGKISGKTVELGLVPVAAAGITVGLFLLDFFSGQLLPVIGLVTIIGVLGGIYEIPLDSYIQVAAPNTSRGQIVGATNFLSFIGVLLASAAIYMITEVFNLQADKGFTIMGFLSLGIFVTFSFQFFDYLTRFIGMILSRLHFRTTFAGLENIPDLPVIYVCKHTAWNDTLLLLGSQRRRMRFFIEEEQKHSKWMRRFYLFLRVVFIPPIEPLENNPNCLLAIRKTLEKGISVCIFVDNMDVLSEIEKLKQSELFLETLKDLNCPLIPVVIDKGQKYPRNRHFVCLLKKFRVPASISFGSTIQIKFVTAPS
jgi:acyl-[acyl-carrier-protein]-phospholipid O-acyltransferase/long-chain-fatty-acid--[acyl-carrier-protein] ligase